MYQDEFKIEEIQINFDTEVRESLFDKMGWSHDDKNTCTVSVASTTVADPSPPSSQKSGRIFDRFSRQWFEQQESSYLSEVLPPPEGLPAFQALGWHNGHKNVDMRPHLWDKASNSFALLDSGSQISCCAPDPGDEIDHSITLSQQVIIHPITG